MRLQMLRPALLALMLMAAPVLAQKADPQQDQQCRALWDFVTSGPAARRLTGQYVGHDIDGCLFTNLHLALGGSDPDLLADELRLRGDGLGVVMFGTELPSGGATVSLSMTISGLRPVMKANDPRFGSLLSQLAQAPYSRAEIVLDWTPQSHVLQVSRLFLDLPGDNALTLTAAVAHVDLASKAGLQMTATGFALTDLQLEVTNKGLFDSSLQMALQQALLPEKGAMPGAAHELRKTLLGVIPALPAPSFDAAAKAALANLVRELPTARGTLQLDFSAPSGFGPARLAVYALTGMPRTMADAAPLFQGTTFDISWTD
ncbi:MAG: hypothetical protein WAT09_16695 [Paracoccaceae bacterium]